MRVEMRDGMGWDERTYGIGERGEEMKWDQRRDGIRPHKR
jgi:hypothetical protein